MTNKCRCISGRNVLYASAYAAAYATVLGVPFFKYRRNCSTFSALLSLAARRALSGSEPFSVDFAGPDTSAVQRSTSMVIAKLVQNRPNPILSIESTAYNE